MAYKYPRGMTAMRKRILVIFCLAAAILVLGSCSQKPGAGAAVLPQDYNDTLLPFEADGKWGYINSAGEVIIEPVYAYAGYFSEGLAVISDGDLYGYINTRNQVVIPPRYTGAGEFANGYAAVCTGDWQSGNMLWGFIDANGKEIVSLRFLYAESFSPEGRALVWIDQGEEVVKGFVNTGGEVFVADGFEICAGFSDGLALVRQDGLYGYINADYAFAIAPQFEFAGSFGEGVAYAEKDGKGYMIDKSGNILAPAEYAFGTFSDGLAVFVKDNLYGYIDREGKVAIEPRFTWAKDFRSGLAAVQAKMDAGGKWGFINTAGEMVIEAVYDEVEDFRNDYTRAYVYSNLKYYILDRTGKVIHSGKYSIE